MKLSLDTKSGKITDFLSDYMATTDPNPLDDRERLFGMAGVTLYSVRGEIHISDLRTFDAQKGNAGRLMKMLCDLADKHGITMTLFAKRYGDRGMATKNLAEWYTRIGFIKKRGNLRDGYEMYRPAQKE